MIFGLKRRVPADRLQQQKDWKATQNSFRGNDGIVNSEDTQKDKRIVWGDEDETKPELLAAVRIVTSEVRSFRDDTNRFRDDILVEDLIRCRGKIIGISAKYQIIALPGEESLFARLDELSELLRAEIDRKNNPKNEEMVDNETKTTLSLPHRDISFLNQILSQHTSGGAACVPMVHSYLMMLKDGVDIVSDQGQIINKFLTKWREEDNEQWVQPQKYC